MSDQSGQNLRTPPPAESPEEVPVKDPAPSVNRERLQALTAQIAAFLCGALAIVGLFQLAKSTPYLGGAGLFAGLVTGIIAALLARDDISARIALRLLTSAAAGVAVALLVYIIAINTYSPGPLSALPYIQPLGGSNHDVHAHGIARFTATVPSRYDQLTISFTVEDSPDLPSENCVNGSQEDITPTYNAALGSVQDIATGTAVTVQIPPGISSFTLAVQFIPQNDYKQCHEDILVKAAQFST
jgi:hypothetical protein